MAAAPALTPTPPVALPVPLGPPPTSSAIPSPTQSQPNASADSPPPASSSPNLSTSPPPSVPSAPPPSVSSSPSPPTPPVNASTPASPPVVTTPPPSPPILSPPPVSTPPPPLLSPPISAAPPPPTLLPPPPPADPPPLSPPPAEPPPFSPPPAVSPSPLSPPHLDPPPTLSPPPSQPPPQPVSPPLPASPPPPNVISSPPPVVSPPPPSATSPENSPPPPVLRPAAPPRSSPPLLNSPPEQSSSPPVSQPRAPPPPGNSSTSGIPNTPPLLSPPVPSRDGGSAVSPSPTNLSNSSPNDVSGSGSAPSSTGSSKNRTGAALGIGVGAVLVLFIIGLAVWCIVKKWKKTSRFGGYVIPSPLSTSQSSDTTYSKPLSSAPLIGNVSRGSRYPYSPPEPGALGNSRSTFTYEELLRVTNGFSEHNLLGEGGFGCVYKGCLPDGREVAVKQLNVGGSQGEREFQAEVEIISRIHHRHLVSLVGYCISEHQRLLVYDYVPNNTLYYHLHGEGRPILDWATRLKIATGAARGIAYLHEDCHPRIIHRDIKSSNILLDSNFEAQVSDFGLARLALDSFTHVTTRVMGTFGYLAPEYASSGKLTEKSDVFSFGVVLLELITGRKPVDGSQPLGDESLVEWARPLLGRALDNREYDDLVDSKLGKNYVEREMFRVIEAAAACVRHSAAKRPPMGQVVRALDSIYDSTDLSNGIRPGESKQYDSAQQSAEIREFRRMAFGTGSQGFSSEFSQTSWRTERKW